MGEERTQGGRGRKSAKITESETRALLLSLRFPFGRKAKEERKKRNQRAKRKKGREQNVSNSEGAEGVLIAERGPTGWAGRKCSGQESAAREQGGKKKGSSIVTGGECVRGLAYRNIEKCSVLLLFSREEVSSQHSRNT